MKNTLLSTLVSAALVPVAAAPALAQSPGPGGQGPVLSTVEGPQARHFAQRQHQGQRASRLPSERAEARLAYLKTALKITDAQQPQWDAFADTLRKQAREADQRVQALRTEAAGREKGARPTPGSASRTRSGCSPVRRSRSRPLARPRLGSSSTRRSSVVR